MGRISKKKKITRLKGQRKNGKTGFICVSEMGMRTKKNKKNIQQYKKEKGKLLLDSPSEKYRYCTRLFQIYGSIVSKNIRGGKLTMRFKNRKKKKEPTLKISFNLKAPNIINIKYANACKY